MIKTLVKTNCLFLISSLLASTVAMADAPVECYDSPKYFVVGKELAPHSVGTDLLVKYKTKPDEKYPCAYTAGNNDFEIKNEWAEYFAGLKDDLLLLDSTCCPGPSGLTIWDLQKKKIVYRGSWSDGGEFRENSLVFWLETEEEKATVANCPEYAERESHGLGSAIETKVILDLTSFVITKTKEKRCSSRQ